jgi:hypothetical protein
MIARAIGKTRVNAVLVVIITIRVRLALSIAILFRASMRETPSLSSALILSLIADARERSAEVPRELLRVRVVVAPGNLRITVARAIFGTSAADATSTSVRVSAEQAIIASRAIILLQIDSATRT